MKCPICDNKLEEDEILFDICDQGHSAKDIIILGKKQKKEIKLLKFGMLEMKRVLKSLDHKFYDYDDAVWVMEEIDEILEGSK